MSCKRAISIASMTNSPDKDGLRTCFLGNSKTTAYEYHYILDKIIIAAAAHPSNLIANLRKRHHCPL